VVTRRPNDCEAKVQRCADTDAATCNFVTPLIHTGADGGSLAGVSQHAQRHQRSPAKQQITSRLGLTRNRRDLSKRTAEEAIAQGASDFSAKLLHLAWHPQLDAIACAASNSLYIFYA
jgi:serine/threonine-protein phosphatase 2A regulatory subunit B